MLTESEKKWLEQRNEHPEDRFCRWCQYNEVRGREEEEGIWCSCNAEQDEPYGECVKEHEYFDRIFEAAEFEARVAVKLACAVSDPWFAAHKQDISADVVLEWARIRIEEEMDDAE